MTAGHWTASRCQASPLGLCCASCLPAPQTGWGGRSHLWGLKTPQHGRILLFSPLTWQTWCSGQIQRTKIKYEGGRNIYVTDENVFFFKKWHGLGSPFNSGCTDPGLCFTIQHSCYFHPERLIMVGLNNAHVYSSLCNLKFRLCTIAFCQKCNPQIRNSLKDSQIRLPSRTQTLALFSQ